MITIDKITDAIKYITEYELVIFDLDDTLYSEKEYVRSGYKAIAEAFPEFYGLEQKMWNAFEQRLNAIDVVLNEMGIYDESIHRECLKIYREHFPKITLYNGVREMLQTIRVQSKIIGLITDGRPKGQRNKIQALSLERMVDRIIITDELGGIQYRKPNEMAFKIMQDTYKIPFEKMVYIGDNQSKDFIAPKRLGMGYIYFLNSNGLYV